MAELIALGKGNQQRLWQSIPEDETIVLGRAPRNGWSVPWDRLISREHAHLRLSGDQLEVSELETARNPIVYLDQPSKQFVLGSSEEFRIGETTFRFEISPPDEPGAQTVVEHTFGTTVLKSGRFENASECLNALCQMPELIAQTRTDVDFATQMADLLLDSLRGSLAAAVLQFEPSADSNDPAEEPKLLRWNTRGNAVQRFRPSRRLMNRAFERQQSVIHLWTEQEAENPQFTMTSDLDWAFCTPIPTASNERWCLYVSGRRAFSGMQEVQSPEDLMAELRLAELIAKFIGAVRQVRSLEQQQTEMRQFFSPAVVETLASEKAFEALQPRQGPICVLFCDVRGFSKKVEEAKDDLHRLLDRVSQALSVMTQSILKYEGVIADFQGDAALGFWGWPSKIDDAANSACKAALLIHRRFFEANQDPLDPLFGFRVGIGIGHGEAIAGRIGSQEQIKVGVFGPVVNLASRLQDLTKQVGAPILIDGPSATALDGQLPEEADFCRRVARLRPRGISTPVDAYALIPKQFAGEPLSAEQRRNYDRAVDAIVDGNWGEAQRLLEQVPLQDGPANFLRSKICRGGAQPPHNWDGALCLE